MHNTIQPASEPGVIWLIGGSDCSAGAGIQADLATAQDLAVPAATVLTAVTAQHNAAVLAVNAVTADVLQSQLDALAAAALAAHRQPLAIKIGLIPDETILTVLVDWLSAFKQRHPTVWLVVDPVRAASSGGCLQQLSLQAYARLLALTDVLTPNRPELRALANLPAHADTALALAPLFAFGVKAIWCKDGHGDGAQLNEGLYLHPQASADFRHWPANALNTSALTANALTASAISASATGQPAAPAMQFAAALQLAKPRLAGQWRGTGCSFATAVACALAQPMLLPDALVLASLYLQHCLQHSTSASQQLARTGWPAAATATTQLQLTGALVQHASWPVTGFATLLKAPGVYPVVSSFSQLFDVAAAGIHTLQLRLKTETGEQLRHSLRAAIAFGHAHQLQLFINDHWQLALELGAFGVHLGQEDLVNADLIAIQRSGLRLGVSTHGYLELLQALQLKPSYIALGHLFATPTKDMPSIPQGLRLVGWQQQLCQQQQIPAVAIGGIDASHLPTLRAMGLAGVAMVRAIVAPGQIRANCEHLLSLWQSPAPSPAQSYAPPPVPERNHGLN